MAVNDVTVKVISKNKNGKKRMVVEHTEVSTPKGKKYLSETFHEIKKENSWIQRPRIIPKEDNYEQIKQTLDRKQKTKNSSRKNNKRSRTEPASDDNGSGQVPGPITRRELKNK